LDGKLVVGSFQYKIPNEMQLYLVKIKYHYIFYIHIKILFYFLFVEHILQIFYKFSHYKKWTSKLLVF
jgi:hypothetical protein